MATAAGPRDLPGQIIYRNGEPVTVDRVTVGSMAYHRQASIYPVLVVYVSGRTPDGTQTAWTYVLRCPGR